MHFDVNALMLAADEKPSCYAKRLRRCGRCNDVINESFVIT